MNENKNLLLAIALSLIVLLGWSVLSQALLPSEPSSKFVDGQQVPVVNPEELPAGTADSPEAIRDRDLVLRETPRVAIQTPSLEGSINLKGARIDDLVLKRHRVTIDRDSQPVRLFSPSGTENSYFASFGWRGQGVRLPDANTVWQASGGPLRPGSPVTLSWDNEQGQVFRIELAVDENYLFTAQQSVANRGGGQVVVRPFQLVSRAGESPDPDDWTMHVGPVGVFNGTADYENDYSTVAEAGRLSFGSRGGWIGFSDKYWLAAVVPGQDQQIEAALRHQDANNRYQADVTVQPAAVAPGQVTTTRSHLFAGAKEVSVMETYEQQLATPIDKAIDWGWFEWFMRPIFSLLVWLFEAIGNFGLAIICLTVIVRLLLYPIAQRQFQSFGKMRAIQPKVQALQERYKDDKQRMQQEMLKLYRDEKVNPAAGCLPILLQIPIFYALYRVLIVAVEMRHQPFVLWVQDLSAPDPLTPVNLFGFLPFTPPAFLLIGVLPIMVGITMWLQQKLNPPLPDPIQRKIFAFMPWVLMVIMAPFAAGLQLYWVTNNILSIAQQKLLYARHPEMKMVPAVPGGGVATDNPLDSPPPPPKPPKPPRTTPVPPDATASSAAKARQGSRRGGRKPKAR